MVENLIFGFKMGEIQVQNCVTFLIWDMGKIFEDWYLPTYTYKQIKKSTPIFLSCQREIQGRTIWQYLIVNQIFWQFV